MANFTSTANISDYLGRSLTTHESDYLANVLLDAVDDYIQRVTGTTFSVGESEARYYDGDGGRWLFIDTATTVTKVEIVTQDSTESVDETLTLGSDYLKYPLNQSYIDRLYKKSSSNLASGSAWPVGKKRTKVTGTFGIAVPDAIVHVATMLASGYLDTTKNLKSESIEGYSRTFSEITNDSEEIREILGQYQDISL